MAGLGDVSLFIVKLLCSIYLIIFVWGSAKDVSIFIEPLLNSIPLILFVWDSPLDVSVLPEILPKTFSLSTGVLLSFNPYISVVVVFNVGCEFFFHGLG